MSNISIYVLIGSAVVLLVVSMIALSLRKKSNQQRQALKELVKSVEDTQRHEKYEKIMTINTYLKAACYIIFILAAIFFILLPVFKMQLSEEVNTENFSLYDTLISLKNEKTDSKHYTDTDKTTLYTFTLIATILIISWAVFDNYKNFKTLNSHGRAEYYARLKLNLWYSKIDPIIIFFFLLIAPISDIIVLKNSKLDFSSYREYTVTDMGRYLIYNDVDGFIMSVYQNNFKLYTGVSGYIAVPILCFVLGVSLMLLSLFINIKIRQQILKEDA